jgi:hypothetical protein
MPPAATMELHEPVSDRLSTFASQNKRAHSDNCDDDDEQGERSGFHGKSP